MIVIRGQNWCGCGYKLKEGPNMICRRCDLPYSKMDIRARDQRLPELDTKFYPCGEITLK